VIAGQNIWKNVVLANYFGSTYLFWQSFPHKQLPVDKEHFDRWMEIFTTTNVEYLPVLELTEITRQEHG
jgi:hemoglobin